MDIERQAVLAAVADRMFGDGQPVRLGRYVILSRLGSGAAGVVYAAYDPDLDRRVAVKVLASDPGREDSRGRARLLREARALAQLSHPHVVAVHDVGVLEEGQAYIAMELVEGEPLDRWAANCVPGWRTAVEVMLGAARGLSAAHQAGLVHRDFKPSNVLVTSTGVARVLDFGLAKPVEEAAGSRSQDEASAALDDEGGGEGSEGSPESLTATGSVLGTPLYMAPEQHRGEPADARADQFAFFATLYEVLFGQRAFRGRGLALAKEDGRIRPPPANVSVPGWLRRVVWRGLSPDPAERFEDMPAVVAALDRPRARAGGFVAAGVALAVIAAAAVSQAEPTPPCTGDGLADAWNDKTRGKLTQTLGRTAAADAAARAVDDFAEAWRGAWRDSCEATRVHGTQSAALGDQRAACLAGLRSDLQALLDAIDDDVGDARARATPAILALAPPSACGVDVVSQRIRPDLLALPEAPRRQIARQIAAARAALALGDRRVAREQADAALTGAEALGYVPLQAEAHLLRGRAMTRADRPREGLEALDRAVALSMQSRVETVEAAARGWRLVALKRAGKLEQARSELDETEAAAARMGEPARLSFALRAAASVYAGLGDLEASLEASERAIEAARRRGEDSLILADSRVARAATLGGVGRLDEAEQELRTAIETFVTRLGADHPRVGTARFNLGSVLFELGRYREALEQHEAALVAMEQALADGHPELADTLIAIAGDRMALGQPEQAIPIAERALHAYERAHGRAHHDTGRAALGLGLALVDVGRVEDGLAALRDADAIYGELYDDGDARRAEPLYALGTALASLDRTDEATPLVRRAVTIGEAGLGRQHPIVAEMQATLDELAHP